MSDWAIRNRRAAVIAFMCAGIVFTPFRPVVAQEPVQVPCTTIPEPAPGEFAVSVGATDWIFDLLLEPLVLGFQGTYEGAPDPAMSINTDNTGATMKWTHPSILANCYELTIEGPNGPIIEQLISIAAARGLFTLEPAPGGNGNCDYQLIPDPDQCTDNGTGGGGGGDAGGGGTGGTGGSDLCVQLELQAGGCYDVYVDGSFQGSVCC